MMRPRWACAKPIESEAFLTSPVAADAPAHARSALLPADLTIVIPTFNERDNVAKLVEQLDGALTGVAWEAIFVDDNSPDGTAEAVRELGRRDPRVRGIERFGRRGLAGGVHRGHACEQRALRGGDGCRPPARRQPAAAHAERADRRHHRPRHRQPLCERGLGRQLPGQAPARKPRVDGGGPVHHGGQRGRSHERFLHDPAGRLPPLGTEPSVRRLQAPVRYSGDRARRAAHPRAALHLRHPHRRQLQARSAERLRFRGAAPLQSLAGLRPAQVRQLRVRRPDRCRSCISRP